MTPVPASSTANSQPKTLSKPGWIISLLTVAGSICIIRYCPPNYAIHTSIAALVIVIPLFTVFLIAIAYGSRNRNPFAILVFIISNIVSIILMFANIYRTLRFKDTVKDVSGIADMAAQHHTFIDAVYFSTVTWTTLGYGDIIPTVAARPFAAIEAFFGYLIMGLLVAALTAMLK